MNDLTQTFQEMPLSSLIAVGLLVVVGLMLWLAGRKLLRMGFAIVGLVAGATIGWMVGQSLNMGAAAWIIAAIGGFVLACIMAVAFRFTVAAAMGVIFATVSPMCVLTFAEWQVRSEGKSIQDAEFNNPLVEKGTAWIQQADTPETRKQASEILETAESALKSVKDQVDRAMSAHAELAELEQFTKRMIEVIRQKWDGTPESLRPTLTVSMIAGGAFGVFLGILAPSLSAAAITALGGSLLLLCGLQIFAVRFGVAEKLWLPSTGTGWLMLWLITSVVGIVIQWTFRRRAADKAS